MKGLEQSLIVLVRNKKNFHAQNIELEDFFLLCRDRKYVKDRFLFMVLITEHNHFFTDFSF